jgi:hypothetical protein
MATVRGRRAVFGMTPSWTALRQKVSKSAEGVGEVVGVFAAAAGVDGGAADCAPPVAGAPVAVPVAAGVPAAGAVGVGVVAGVEVAAARRPSVIQYSRTRS